MVKTVEDYVELAHERFPELSEKEIKKILTFGLRMYHYVNKLGCDVLIKDDTVNKYTMFTGQLGYDPLKHYIRGLFKWRMKERMIYRLRQTEWDGYYYFGLTEDRYQIVKKQIDNKQKKIINFGNIFFYKVKKEIEHDHSIKHVFRTKYPLDCGFKFYLKIYNTRDDFEYLGENQIKIWMQKPEIVEPVLQEEITLT